MLKGRQLGHPWAKPVVPDALDTSGTGAHVRSLRSNFSWMFAANVVHAGCQWATLAVLARLGTPAMVGQFVLALAITTPVLAFCMLQLRVVQATDAKHEFRFGHYLALRLVMTVPALAAVLGISLVSGYPLATTWIVLAVAFSAILDSLNDIVYGLLQQHERMDRIAQSILIKGLLSFSAFTLTLAVTHRVTLSVLAIAMARLTVLLAWDLPNGAQQLRSGSEPCGADRGQLLPRWETQRLLSLARLAFPLGLVMMLVVASSSVPRYVVDQYFDAHSLGIFGAIGYFSVVGIVAVRALGESATARLSQTFASGRKRDFCLLIIKLAAFGAALGVAGVVVAAIAGRPLLGLLYGPEYAEHADLLVWVMAGAAFSYVAWFVSHGVTAARFFRSQIPLNAVVAALTIVACLWLVPRFGLLGAAWSMLVTAAAQIVGSTLVIVYALRRRQGRQPKREAATI